MCVRILCVCVCVCEKLSLPQEEICPTKASLYIMFISFNDLKLILLWQQRILYDAASYRSHWRCNIAQTCFTTFTDPCCFMVLDCAPSAVPVPVPAPAPPWRINFSAISALPRQRVIDMRFHCGCEAVRLGRLLSFTSCSLSF